METATADYLEATQILHNWITTPRAIDSTGSRRFHDLKHAADAARVDRDFFMERFIEQSLRERDQG